MTHRLASSHGPEIEKGQWLIAYEDDSFRLIKGYGVYPTLTSPHSVVVLN